MTGNLRRTVALTGLVGLLLTACSEGTDAGVQPAVATSAAGVAAGSSSPHDVHAFAPTADQCTQEPFTEQLIAEPETSLERQLQQTLVACSTRAFDAVNVRNTSSHVLWVVDGPLYPYWGEHEDPVRPLAIGVFRDAVRALPATERPQGFTLEPGRSVTLQTPPEAVHLSLHPGLQAMWTAASMGTQAVMNRARTSAATYLGRGKPTRGVVVACALDGFEVGLAIPDYEDDPIGVLRKALGIVGNGDCAQRIRAEKPPALAVEDMAKVAKPRSSWAKGAQQALRSALRLVQMVVT
ncbi:hypothetical protein E4P40_12390 [Blastococcus sp. CT_GayMR20]|uniref:hypothetical protein n=1 Tax=Blastococcus sp. CT_GayMR20 TaxID=2559609 RepID=UPI0010735DA8|nr:hypothetical protein [Blastococcus sp. CT_GayMR20]TFV86717.1 hypothetical protein E4P40_12390 [Blastococcus sp. CT_GayMR20]